MGKLFALLFTCILAVTFMGLDYFLARQAKAGPAYGVREHLSLRTGGLSETLFPPNFEDMLPVAPEGWSVRDWAVADLALVSGRAASDLPADLQGQIDARTTAMKTRMPDLELVRRTYQNGQDVVLVELLLVPEGEGDGPGGAALDSIFGASATMGEPRFFGSIRGLNLQARTEGSDGTLRHMNGSIGKQIHLNVVTNADDRRAFDVLARLNVAGLNKLSAEPVKGLGEGRLSLASDSTAGPAIERALGLKPAEDGTEAPKVGFQRADGGFGKSCDKRAGSKFCSTAESE